MTFRPLIERIVETPRIHDAAAASRLVEAMGSRFSALPESARALLRGVGGASPYLSRLIARAPDEAEDVLRRAPESCLADRLAEFRAAGELKDPPAQMRALRVAKARAALLIALAEIAGAWPTLEAAAALSDAADAAASAALRAALRGLGPKGFRGADAPHPEEVAGIAVLAMGKMGARELNYSSDIDLIVLFDPDAPAASDPADTRAIAVAAARQMVKLLVEQTGDGYVFRADLRLRPDPGVSAAAVSIRAAEAYYEAHGQNWERAAFIKARAAAGDLAIGAAFLDGLRPFVWRKYLDYAAIEDIHSIKRQIHAVKGGGDIEFFGHDLKIGRGGIREIEFLAQTQQLILGGKNSALRARRTLDALDALVVAGHMRAEDRDTLAANYRYLRRVEHRLQMILDEQTHKIPRSEEDAARLAAFLGEDGVAAFEARLTDVFRSTHRLFATLFEQEERLSAPTGSLIFTGVENDPATLETLRRLGFARPSDISDRIRSWHTGSLRATRSPRARELLTKLGPRLLEALARAGDPDAAFVAFDEFLERLPSGVQVFSLFAAHPEIFDVLVRIMTISPFLGRQLSRRRHLIEAALESGWPGPPPNPAGFLPALEQRLARASTYEEKLNEARRWGAEENFEIAARLALGEISPEAAAGLFTPLAEAAIAALLDVAAREHEKAHGRIQGRIGVVALGRLGAGDMTAQSDLDLVFIYDAAPDALSDGPRPLDASTYYIRLVRRFLTALSAATEEGMLYDVDMKLRPSGSKGPWAVSLSAFEAYYAGDAWTWEAMALLKARAVAGPPDFVRRLDAVIDAVLTRPRDPDRLRADVLEMRARVEEAKGAVDPFDVKHAAGGLVDFDFTLAFLALKTAPEAGPPPRGAGALIDWLAARGALSAADAAFLSSACGLFRAVLQVGRAASGAAFDRRAAGEALSQRLAAALGAGSIEAAEERILDAEARVRGLFGALVGGLARRAN
jgi:glutamate-ammonia-ligase adenylyltransferase